jgi:uncharacterized protein (DUF885 family)
MVSLKKIITVGLLINFGFFCTTTVAGMNAKRNGTTDKLNSIATSYEKTYFDLHPEYASFWGRNDAAHDRFSDHSLAATYAWQKKEDEFLSQLLAITESDLKNTPAHTTYQLLKQKLQSQKSTRVCKDELWEVNPLWGWHNKLTTVAETQPIGTPQNRAMAIKRWKTVDQIVADEIHNLKTGIKQGYTAPKPAVTRVIQQIKIILNTSVEKSPFLEFAQRDGDPQFKTQMGQIVENVINPSLKRYVKFLEEEYLPKARDRIGVSALPGGTECYQSKIYNETTLHISPKAIYDYGIEHMQQLKREVAVIGQKHYGTQDMANAYRQARTNPQNFFTSEQAILDYNLAALSRAKAKTPAWFDQMPKSEGTVKPYALHRAQTGAAGEYHPPSDDGTRPGIFYINTFEPHKRSRVDQEATLFHELIPGHHFQVALAHEDKSSHSLDKYLWNAGYGEGWALYVERLADEMGLYSDDISRLGMLSNESLRTARLVVDPGIHVMGWTRDQAVSYLKQHTALDDNLIEGEVDRYIMAPGQATSYMLGKREIENLRTLAQNTLKDKFDIRQYHNQVLKHGSVTLPMLKTQVEDWLAKN